MLKSRVARCTQRPLSAFDCAQHRDALNLHARPTSISMLSSNRQHEKQTLLHLVHSGMSLRQLSHKECVVLGAICLCTMALLAALQHGRVFLGDEIGTLRYLKESPSYILTHFGTWLSMNYFIFVEKGVAWLCGAADWRLTLLPVAAAVAIVPLTASLALKLTSSTRTALIAASLAAFNHFLVLWGPQIRAYSLLVALSLLAINEFFIGLGSETGGVAYDVPGQCYCCYSRILTAFTQSHSSFYC